MKQPYIPTNISARVPPIKHGPKMNPKNDIVTSHYLSELLDPTHKTLKHYEKILMGQITWTWSLDNDYQIIVHEFVQLHITFQLIGMDKTSRDRQKQTCGQ
jgi:hypothetical protein